jgi:hypothetical protein
MPLPYQDRTAFSFCTDINRIVLAPITLQCQLQQAPCDGNTSEYIAEVVQNLSQLSGLVFFQLRPPIHFVFAFYDCKNCTE